MSSQSVALKTETPKGSKKPNLADVGLLFHKPSSQCWVHIFSLSTWTRLLAFINNGSLVQKHQLFFRNGDQINIVLSYASLAQEA